MKLKKVTESYAKVRADLLALPLTLSAARNTAHDGAFRAVDAALDGALGRTMREEGFSRRLGSTLLLHTFGRIGAARVLLVGLGKPSDSVEPLAKVFAHHAARAAKSRRARRVAVAWPFPDDASEGVEQLALGALLGAYRFDRYRTSKADDESGGGGTAELVVLVPARLRRKLTGASFDAAVARARATSEGVCLARDLVNEPPNTLNPQELVARARKLADASPDLELEVLDRSAMEERGMGLLLGVTAGAAAPPALIRLSYTPPGAEPARRSVALVGKGITFDSGGLDLKTRGNMKDMKCDMAGAAAVLGTMAALPARAPRVVVHGIVPAAENMTGAGAYRPGDVLRSANGKTVEIMNTDAEGRLVLADALHFALGLKVDEIIDLATLTGACAVALGERTAGLFANRRNLADGLLRASRATGESLWELPLDRRLRRELDSHVADCKNIGGRYGGAIHGALFLEDFVGKRPWAHLDIAGPAFAERAVGTTPRGGTGFGVATLLRYLDALGVD